MEASGHCTLWLGVSVKSVYPLDGDRKDPKRSLGMWAKRRDWKAVWSYCTRLRISDFLYVLCMLHMQEQCFCLFLTCKYNFLCTVCYALKKRPFLLMRYIQCIGLQCPGVKRLEPGVDHPPYIAPRLKKEYRYTSTPPLGLRGLF
jgi:hypothetical protein